MQSVFFYRFDGLGKGPIGIADDGDAIVELFFDGHAPSSLVNDETPRRETPLIKRAARQIEKYLAGKLREFTVPVAFMRGTGFQLEVWRALQTVPYGETRSYKEIAELIGRPKAVRAVGMANNRNPISIIVPCHRVIGHNGALVGYGGGLPVKRRLLDLEQGGPMERLR